MPIIDIKLVEGAFSDEQKRQLLPKITDAVEEVHPGLRDVTFITISEIKGGQWGIAGTPIDKEKVAAHAQQQLAAQA
jgi:4-oxalocrotonate tautomerase